MKTKKYCYLRYIIFQILLATIITAKGQSVIFEDSFNRPNNSVIGNGWLEHGGGLNIIESNRAVIDNGANEDIGDNFIYTDLGEIYTSCVLTGVISFDDKPDGGPLLSTALYIGINAREVDIKHDDGPNMGTYGKGYGAFIGVNGDLLILDETFIPGSVEHTGLAKGVHPMTEELNKYHFELKYFEDKSLEVNIWRANDSKPMEPTFSYISGETGPEPTFSGTNIFLGVTDEGELQIDEVMLTRNVSSPSSSVPSLTPKSSLMLFALLLILASLAIYNRKNILKIQ